jgi:cyclopropane fatty-acyl-phospholipid synthase-like methyltransferase
MSSKNKGQVNSGVRAILSHPVIYNSFQRIVGIDKAFSKYVNEIIRPVDGSRILDIGCGEGYILNFLSHNIDYVGYDISSPYIEYAKEKFRGRGRFVNARVSEMKLNENELFDIVLATGLLHHLDDREGVDLFKVGYNCLGKGGVMYTYDNSYFKEQSPIAKFISSRDRGRHVRYPEEYQKIAKAVFEEVQVIIRHDMIRIPQTVCILKCIKG